MQSSYFSVGKEIDKLLDICDIPNAEQDFIKEIDVEIPRKQIEEFVYNIRFFVESRHKIFSASINKLKPLIEKKKLEIEVNVDFLNLVYDAQ